MLTGLGAAVLALGTAVTVAVSAGAVPTAPAAVGAAHTAPAASTQALQIHSTADDLITPATATPGPATFHASTTSDSSGWVGLARLHEGVTWEEFRAALQDTLSTDAPSIIAGSQALMASAELLGGVVISPGRAGSFTQWLRPGSYLLFDYLDVLAAPQPRHRTLTVSGEPAGQPLIPTATLVSTSLPGVGPRFDLIGTVRAGQPLLFINGMQGQLNEAIFFRIGDDVTAADLEAWFQLFGGDTGTWPETPPPFAEEFGFGCLPLSPGSLSIIQGPLQTGRYVVVNWLKDATDGRSFVKQGHYKIIDVW
jgi:hypothetical protein